MMDKGSGAEQAIRAASFNGIDIYVIRSDKFKTSSIHFYFQDNLARENVTKNAMLPAVIRRGSEDYPTSRDIAMGLEKLYGASFDCGVSKKGERHLLHFYTEFLSSKYIPGGSDTFAAGFNLLYGIISKPALENGRFSEKYLGQEKDKLRMLIESRVNDKMQYSVDRCLEEVCREEPYSIYEYGFVSDLDSMSAGELTDRYKVMLESYPLNVYLVGDITGRETEMVVDALSGLERKNLVQLGDGFMQKRNVEPRHVTETMNVTQGKLCLGFRTNTAPGGSAFYNLMVYNSILGGGIHSKLFQNVREKASMAYYAYSRLEKFKGLMIVSSGIETGNKDKALDIIQKQLEEIKNGAISEYEIEASVKSIETGIKSLADSQAGIVDFYLGQAISGSGDNFADIIENVKKVTKEDVARTAKDIVLETVYFLTSP
ncbi:MAG: EF-P 5-aminopentanol modification-associated protein YfmF [Bacillota bacterium]